MNVYGKQVSSSRKKKFGKFVHMVLLKKKKRQICSPDREDKRETRRPGRQTQQAWKIAKII